LSSNCYNQEYDKEKKKQMQERRALHFQINQSWFWRKEKKEEEKSSTKKKKKKRCRNFAEFIKSDKPL